MVKRKVPAAVIRRMPRYYRYLGDLLSKGIDRISSSELSERMGVTASQIRQDLNHFGGFGQQGYGYNVESLYKEIGRILGQDMEYRLIIVGAGNLGQAVAKYTNFYKKGYKVMALFDANEALAGSCVAGHPVYSMRDLPGYLCDNKIDIAVLTIPKEGASEIVQQLFACGIRAFWNFASVDINVPKEEVVIENVHLSDSLRVLSYRLRELNSLSESGDAIHE